MTKIVYLDISPDKVPPYESIEKLREQAAVHFDALASKLGFLNKEGKLIEVAVKVDTLNFDSKYFYNGRASRSSATEYNILLGGGLLARLDALSRALAANKNTLRGCRHTRLLNSQVRKDGRQKAMSDFAFHYMLDLIFWHEVAHVALGHVDWLAEEFGIDEYVEMPMTPMTAETAAVRRVLEGDADRQAAIWSTAVFDYSIDQNAFLRYRTKRDAFYDFGYLIGAMFSMLDAVSTSKEDKSLRTHPEPQHRVGTMLAFVEDYLKLQDKYRGVHSVLHQSCIAGALQAVHDIVHENRSQLDVIGMVKFLSMNGEELDRLGIRSFQLTPAPGGTSFDLSEV